MKVFNIPSSHWMSILEYALETMISLLRWKTFKLGQSGARQTLPPLIMISKTFSRYSIFWTKYNNYNDAYVTMLGWLDRWKLALGDELQLWPKPIGANQTRGTQDLERKHDRWNHGIVSKLPVWRLLTIVQQGPELEDKTILSGDNMRFLFLLINGPRIYDVLKLQIKMVSLGARCANPRAPHQKIPPQSN